MHDAEFRMVKMDFWMKLHGVTVLRPAESTHALPGIPSKAASKTRAGLL